MHHKDMEVWKQAMSLVFDIYEITEKFPKDELFGLTSQMRRCVVSVPSNIAEGCGRFSNKETLRFVGISLGSLAELETQILIAQHLKFIENSKELEDKVKKINALLIGLKKHLEKENENNLT